MVLCVVLALMQFFYENLAFWFVRRQEECFLVLFSVQRSLGYDPRNCICHFIIAHCEAISFCKARQTSQYLSLFLNISILSLEYQAIDMTLWSFRRINSVVLVQDNYLVWYQIKLDNLASCKF